MTTTGWPQILFLIGVLASLLIAIVYVRVRASVRKQNRKLGWFTTVATVFGVVLILYTSLHGDLFQFLFSHAQGGSFTTGTPGTSAPVAHAVAVTAVHSHVGHPGQLVTQQIAGQKVMAHPSPSHAAAVSSPSQPIPFLIMLERIASSIGIAIVLCIVLVGLLLLVRHLRQRQEDAFLDAPCFGCAVCGQEGEFPAYRDKKGQLTYLCSNCIKQFQVTPIA